ncbi:Nonsense-mediated mRNA decay protein 5 [Friedmanniomyces endolithicus]|nr:Nonsense-mediated mRNA decay protein 5 [Friedmanniomyces endolithicus]
MEPYGLFKAALHSLSQQDPALYAQLTATLGPEEQQVIKGAIEKADHVAAQQAALQEQQANGGDTSGVQQQQQQPHTNSAG